MKIDIPLVHCYFLIAQLKNYNHCHALDLPNIWTAVANNLCKWKSTIKELCANLTIDYTACGLLSLANLIICRTC